MTSLTARLVRQVLRRTVKPSVVGDSFVADLRTSIDRPGLPTRLGGRVGWREVADDELGPVAGEWVGVPVARRHVLYLHGGYYVAGRPRSYRGLAGRVAAGLDADVLLLDYRLAPEHPYPAAVDDAFGAYRRLVEAGIDPAALAIAGDSAGGGLALATLLRAKSEGVPLPAAVAVFSPWTDLTGTADSLVTNDERDDMLSAAALRTAAAHYAAGQDLVDPEISPLFGDLSGLPPLFVTVDRSETLLDDAVRLVDRARAAGVDATLHQAEGLFHVWPILVPVLREARQTVDEVIAFLDERLAGRHPVRGLP